MSVLFRILIPASLFLSGCVSEPVARVRIRPAPLPLSVDVVTRLAAAGVSDSVIVEEIKTRGMIARPTSDQVVESKKEGLSDAVLLAMNEAPVRSGQEVIVEPGGPPPDAYSYYPYYPYYPYPYYYGPWWYGGFYWGWPYHTPYYYPYGHSHVYGGSIHRYR